MKKSLKRLAYSVERRLFRHGLVLRNATLPHFLGLGPGQTGTTWLSRHLDAHPEVHVTPRKETDYFSKFFETMSLLHYASLFQDGRYLVRGEITPSYSILKRDRIANVAQLLPDLRLILTVRNPVERSWSAARRVMERLGTTIEDIADEQLFDYLDKEWAYRPPTGVRLVGDYEPGLLEGHYTRIMDNWLACFPSEQLLLVFFDDIKSRPAETLRRVCRHIGVDAEFDWSNANLEKPVNSNAPHRMPTRVRQFLIDKYRSEIESLAARVGGAPLQWLEAA